MGGGFESVSASVSVVLSGGVVVVLVAAAAAIGESSVAMGALEEEDGPFSASLVFRGSVLAVRFVSALSRGAPLSLGDLLLLLDFFPCLAEDALPPPVVIFLPPVVIFPPPVVFTPPVMFTPPSIAFSSSFAAIG